MTTESSAEIMDMHEDLEWLRNAMGLTQQEAADQLGVHLNTLRRWESGTVKLDEISVKQFNAVSELMDKWREAVRERVRE